MSYISPQGEQSTISEITLLEALNNLSLSGAGQAIRKSGTSEFENVSFDPIGNAVWGQITGTLSDQTDLQTALDLRCLESVFGTAIGTGLTLDTTTLKTHAALQSIAGLSYVSGSFIALTGANTYTVRTYAQTLSDIGAAPALGADDNYVTDAEKSALHASGGDSDLDSTFEATFVKKADTVNVLSDITSTGANIEDAVTKKHANTLDHTQGTDTALGAQAENLDMNTHKIVGVVDPTANQEAATKKYVDDNAGGGIPTNITVADESADTTCFPLFVTAATGDLGPKTAAGLTFNSSTDVLAATGFSGPLTGNVTGTATNLSGTPALPNGTTATTQSASDNSTKLATTAYADTAAAAGGATTALDNLASVAINLSLTSDTDITDDLGTGDVRWKDIHAATLNAGLTATDTLKLRGRDVDGSTYVDILTITSANTVTADLSSTVTIGSNAILYSGGALGTPSGGTLTNCDGTAASLNIGGTAAVATAITVADESFDDSCNVVFVTAATGNLPPKTGTNLTFASSTGILTATGFAGDITGALTGNADTATLASTITVDATTSDTTCFVGIFESASGSLEPQTDATLTYNANTGLLSSTLFAGDLTGNVTGNCSGSSGTCDGLAASATILATTRAIYGNNFNGSSALTQVIASTYGGTGNGFTKFTGPATAEKTFTLPNANATLLYAGGDAGTPSALVGTNISGTGASFTAGAVTGFTPASGSLTLAGADAVTITTTGETNSTLPLGTKTLVATDVATLSSLTSIGTIGTGVWEGTDVGVAHGGTGVSAWTQYLIPYAATTTSFGQIAIGNDGQVLTSGGAGVAPSFEDATGGSGITWSAVTADATMAVNTGSLANKGTLLTLTLPATSSVGATVRVAGFNSGLWKVAQAANQYIKYGNQTTATGSGGSLASVLTYDAVELVCIVENLGWVVVSSVGNVTVT